MPNDPFKNLNQDDFLYDDTRADLIVSDRACDRCFTKKIKCSMHLPACEKCIDTCNPCTYLRKSKPQRKIGLNKAKQPNPLKGTLIAKKYAELVLIQSEITAKILNLPEDDLIKNLYRNTLSGALVSMLRIQFDVKNANEILLVRNMLDYDKSLYIKSLVVPKFIRNRGFNEFSIPGPISDYGTPELYYRSTEAYFTYFNPFSPLFTHKSFFKLKRSRLLNLIIYSLGLQQLGLNSDRIDWIEDMSDEIVHLAKPALFKPCVDSIQVMRIMLCYFTIAKVAPINQGTLIIMFNMAHALGLHLGLPKRIKVCEEVRYERSMAYANVLEHISQSSHIELERFKMFPYHFPLPDLLDLTWVDIFSISQTPNFHEPYQDVEKAELSCLLIVAAGYRVDVAIKMVLDTIRFKTNQRETCSKTLRNLIQVSRIRAVHLLVLRLQKLTLYKSKCILNFPKLAKTYEKVIDIANSSLFVTIARFYELEYFLNENPDLPPHKLPAKNPKYYTDKQVLATLTQKVIDSYIRVVNLYCNFGKDANFQPMSLAPVFSALNNLKCYRNFYQLKSLDLVINNGVAFLKTFKAKNFTKSSISMFFTTFLNNETWL